MKLYIAQATCSLAVQVIANELGLNPELIHYDVFDKSTTSSDDFTKANPLSYVPVLVLDDEDQTHLTETTIITSYLADQHLAAGLIPPHGTMERVKFDKLLTFLATEIAQKHIPLMRKLQTEFGTQWTRDKLVAAYTQLDEQLSDGRAYLTGEKFTVADAYVWATLWHERSGAPITHLRNFFDYIARIEARPSVKKALKDEAGMVAQHNELKAAA
ncbi:glutathione S-transferase [Burkholderiaceae bacterium 16]|nr:glutathione S-transferase [Burkholderiaceae bacterium 16]